jgi:hypothetical protein
MFLVKWYEPFGPGPKPETVLGFTLPTGQGWHEQSVSDEVKAHGLADALHLKGFKLVRIIRLEE